VDEGSEAVELARGELDRPGHGAQQGHGRRSRGPFRRPPGARITRDTTTGCHGHRHGRRAA
jgi:hypothetical protein